MGKIIANKSLNDGYRYIWDEDTKFIVYQNNKGDIILGTANHEGQIKEREIKKLCELKINYFRIFQLGCGSFINYENIIYVKNFLNLGRYYEVEKILQELSLLSSTVLYYEEALKNKERNIKHFDTIYLINDSHDDYPNYWKLEQDNGKSSSLTIESIILKILLWFYDIGKTRTKFNDCGFDEVEDYRNLYFFEVIHEKFKNNNFKILKESKLTVRDVYDQAQKENKNYDKIIKYLNKYILENINGNSNNKEDILACKKVIQYYTIVGKPYPFAQKLEEEKTRRLKLLNDNFITHFNK